MTGSNRFDIADRMDSRQLITSLCRLLLGAVLVCGLLLLPPAAAHAESRMHEAAAEAQHMSHDHDPQAVDMAPAADLMAETDGTHSHDGDLCCGGICVSMALPATQDDVHTAGLTKHAEPGKQLPVSNQPRGLLRPPRA